MKTTTVSQAVRYCGFGSTTALCLIQIAYLGGAALGQTQNAVTYTVQNEHQLASQITWNDEALGLATNQVTKQTSMVKLTVKRITASKRFFLRGAEVASLNAKYPSLRAASVDCNLKFRLSDVSGWLRPSCNFHFAKPSEYLLQVLNSYLDAHPGYNSGEDRLEIVEPLSEVSSKKWDYSINNGKFTCPQQVRLGTSAGFPLLHESSGEIRGFKITVSPNDRWQFKVEVLARDIASLAKTAKTSSDPWGITFSF